MGFIRKDYLLDDRVYYAVKRGKRPHEFTHKDKSKALAFDVFGKGNEKITGEEIGRVECGGSWTMRWFPNKFAAVQKTGDSKLKGPQLFKQGTNFGFHEVIVETETREKQLADLSVEEIATLLKVYNQRILKLEKKKNVKYVQVFKNHGSEAGTSILHEHSQVIAIGHLPKRLQEKIKAAQLLSDPYSKILKEEAKSKRSIFSDEHVVAFCPFASRFAYEAWIYSTKKKTRLDQFTQEEYWCFARTIKEILTKLHSINASYNMHVHYCPKGKEVPFHIEITPRINVWAGFELGTDVIINSVFPEDAAKWYRST